MDIHVKRNGSGRITIEYQIPAAMENLGKFDGNQAWPVIPAGKRDWERSISRIDGLKLVSFSSKNKSDDIITKAVIDFDKPETLAAFLGNKADYADGKLNIKLLEPADEINADLLNLLRQTSGDKKINISFKADGKTSVIKVSDSKGNAITESSSFNINTAEIFDYRDGLELKISL